MRNENYNWVKRIADELHEVATNECYRIDGEFVTREDLEKMIGSGEVTKEELEELDDYGYTDRIEAASMWDYFDDCYDIEYTIGSDLAFRGVRIMVACGGPNIYINTSYKRVELYWWTESVSAYMSKEAVDAINEVFEEVYKCR